eukprot:114680-Chlamydomonas_euryale.AAC.5
MVGADTNSTLGADSHSCFLSASHPQPSRNMPYTYTPSEGGVLYCSWPTPSISKSYPTSSIGILLRRAKFCRLAVRNDCTKKKPESQKAGGADVWYQVFSIARRRYKSSRYDARGLSEGHAVDADGAERGLEVGAHDKQALDREADATQRVADDSCEPIEARHLLRQHRVHALLVQDRVLALHRLNIKRRRKPLEALGDRRAHTLLGAASRRATATAAAHLEQARKHGGCVILVLGDVGVLVQAKRLGHRRDWQALDVLQVAAAVAVWRRVVQPGRGQLVTACVVDNLRAVALFQHRVEQAAVLVVGHAAAVVALPSDIAQRRVRDLVVLVQKH